MGKQGAETRLVAAMRKAGAEVYGERLVVVKYHGSAYSESGVSDLLCCIDGRFVAIEVKAPESYGNSVEAAREKGPTLKQKAFLNRVETAGGEAAVCASVADFLGVLEVVGREDPHPMV